MKQISTKNKILIAVSILLIIAAIIVVALNGFNVERKYKEYNKIKLYVDEEISFEEANEIVKEAMGNEKYTVQMIDTYNDAFQVTAKTITEEQRDTIVNKINEKYPVEGNTEESEEIKVRIDKNDVKILYASNIRLRDVFKPYVLPFTVTTIIVLLYIIIRNYKQGIFKVLIKSIITLVLPQILLFSILAIIRFPMGRFTPALVIIVYMMSVMYLSKKYKAIFKLKK